ncbi:MAG: SDR family oxidoreductase [Syntrophaceae bacterium]|nr:SDR family oxidoreductase [Syntrophaceae bacterium]
MKECVWQALEGAKLVDGKAVLITGAAAGIGRACALLFAHQGGRLALVDLQEEGLTQVCEEVRARGGRAIGIPADVTQTPELDRIFRRIEETYDGLDILINNAGGGLPTDFLAISLEEWNRILNLNLTSLFLLSQRAVAIFRRKGCGAIVNLSSQAGRSVSPTAGVHYTASKAGVLGLTRHLARILAKDNIRVNAVCPGITNSERLMKRIQEKGSEEDLKKAVPLGRIGDVDEVAACCLFLASDLAGYVTGVSLDVNGGALMM